MKKILAILILLQSVTVNAYEYASDHDNRRYNENEREEWIESDSSQNSRPRYQQSYQQPPIQIYIAPNQNSYSRDERHHRHSENNQYREELYWRERREELEQQPQRLYRENQFEREDTHW